MSAFVLIHDPEEGHSGQIIDFRNALEKASGERVELAEVHGATVDPSRKIGCYLFWCALKWYTDMRIRIPGRPMFCALSWSAADLFNLVTPVDGLLDSGLHAIFTNCEEFVKQSTAALPVTYQMKPLSPPLPRDADMATFGTVLPNVADRDFSQLIYTNKFLRPHGSGVTIFIRKDEHKRLPEDLSNFCTRVDDIERAYRQVKYFIPAPRITDYRAGLFPPEVTQAIKYGCLPLIIHHPILEQNHGVTPMFNSLTKYDMALKLAFQGNAPVSVRVPATDADTHFNLATRVTQAYRRFKANAKA